MAVKIAVTVCDYSAAIHFGGDVHRVTSIIELSDDQVPEILRRYFEDIARVKGGERGLQVNQTVSLSLVE